MLSLNYSFPGDDGQFDNQIMKNYCRCILAENMDASSL